jgi:hypothetical protein
VHLNAIYVIIDIVPFCRSASEEVIKQSNIQCCIPMATMVDSFNVSFVAGILMHHVARNKITRSVSSHHFSFDIFI